MMGLFVAATGKSVAQSTPITSDKRKAKRKQIPRRKPRTFRLRSWVLFCSGGDKSLLRGDRAQADAFGIGINPLCHLASALCWASVKGFLIRRSNRDGMWLMGKSRSWKTLNIVLWISESETVTISNWAWQFLGVVTDVYPNRLLQAIALLSTQYSR